MESSKLYVLVLVIVGLVNLISPTKAELTCGEMIQAFHSFDYTNKEAVNQFISEHKAKATECGETMTCGEIMKEMAKWQLQEVEKCTKELNYQTALEKKEKSFCTFKCIMRKTGMLDENGKIDEHFLQEQMDKFVDIIPPKLMPLKEKGEKMFHECRVEHEHKMDNNDDTCQSYKPMIQCMMGMVSLCKDM